MPTRNDSDSGKPEAFRRHEADRERAQAPRDAGIERADAEAGRLVERGVDAHRLGRDRVVADRDQRAADPAADEIARRPSTAAPPRRQADEIEPLVGVQRQAERRVRLRQLHALRAAGPGVEALVGEHLRRRDGEREGREREIEAAEAQRRKAEQEARAEADEARERNRRPNRARRASTIRIAAP